MFVEGGGGCTLKLSVSVMARILGSLVAVLPAIHPHQIELFFKFLNTLCYIQLLFCPRSTLKTWLPSMVLHTAVMYFGSVSLSVLVCLYAMFVCQFRD